MSEEIVPVPGYEEYYGATRDGRVFSYNYNRTGETKELAQSSLFDKRRKSTTMYKRAKMFHINKNTPTAIHRVIALTFVPNPKGHKCVNHIDGDKGNNNASNLEWCSIRDNVRHAEENGLADHVKGEDHGMHKLTEKEVVAIREELDSIPEYKGQLIDIAKKYNVSNFCIFDIKHRRSWRHI